MRRQSFILTTRAYKLVRDSFQEETVASIRRVRANILRVTGTDPGLRKAIAMLARGVRMLERQRIEELDQTQEAPL